MSTEHRPSPATATATNQATSHQPPSSKRIKLTATKSAPVPPPPRSSTQAVGNGSGLLTVACVWQQLRDVYSVTERDLEYAYRGAASFLKIDKLYSGATTQLCQVVLLIDVHHGSLENFLRVSDALLRVHGLLIVSLTWFREDRARMLKLDNEAARQRFEEDLAASYLNSDDEDYDEMDCDDDDSTGYQSTGSTKPPAAKHVSAVAVFGHSDDRFTGDEQQMDELLNLTLEDLTTVRAIYVGRRCVRDRMRNAILMQFFAKLILYLRPLPICDKLAIISHKAFRLVRGNSIDQWYHDLLTNATTNGDVAPPPSHDNLDEDD